MEIQGGDVHSAGGTLKIIVSQRLLVPQVLQHCLLRGSGHSLLGSHNCPSTWHGVRLPTLDSGWQAVPLTPLCPGACKRRSPGWTPRRRGEWPCAACRRVAGAASRLSCSGLAPGSSVLQSTSSQSHVVMQDLPSPFYVWKSGLGDSCL